MKILLTGFEPFGKYNENSSWVAAEKVATQDFFCVDVVLKQMPVSFAGVAKALRDAVEECNPAAVVMLGQAANIDYIKLERIAINMMDAAAADNDGYIADEEPISIDGAAALFTNVDVKALCRAVEEQGIPAKVSNSAGLYVCNRIYYEALQLCGEKPGMKALFVHLPFYTGQLPVTEGKPSMPLDTIIKAVEIVINEIGQ